MSEERAFSEEEIPRLDDLPDHVVLYDGVCGLCHASVQWLMDHDTANVLRFAPLQGPTAEALRRSLPAIPENIDTVVYAVRSGGVWRAHLRSRAVVHLLGVMPWPWRALSVGRILPAFLLDPLYNGVAAVRYRIWGRFDACRLPSTEEIARLLP